MTTVNENSKLNFVEFPDNQNHTVYYKLDENFIPVQSPTNCVNIWDNDHVRMPFSPLSFHPIEINERKSVVSRWQLIEKTLKSEIQNVYEIKNVIVTYNSRYESQWDFDSLIELFENNLDADYKQKFFAETYPGMVKLALNLPNLVTKPIPLLRSHNFHSISLSQIQIASLLANAFFCTFPRRNKMDDDNEYQNFPRINFYSLFNSSRKRRSRTVSNKTKIEKLKCILHYFKSVVQEMPSGVITFTRRVWEQPDMVKWGDSDQLFSDILLEARGIGSIFTTGIDSIKVDFANKFVGGGTLNQGAVQEEILFATQPELLVSCLFMEALDDRECVVVQGTQLYSLHSGYGNSFEFGGDASKSYSNECQRDEFCRWKNIIVMMDALKFRTYSEQFTQSKMQRDLDKAYCGFSNIMPFEESLPNWVSTGNWGCGAFGGDVYLKFVLQTMACAQLNRNIIYYTFNNMDFVHEILDFFKYLQDSKCTVGSLWRCLQSYHQNKKNSTLFNHIKSIF